MPALARYRIGFKDINATRQRVRQMFARKRQAFEDAMVDCADIDFNAMQDACPRLTHFMALHMLLEFSDDDLTYFIGWAADKFVGLENPVLKTTVKVFYPVFVIHGTSRQAPNDFRLEVMRRTRPLKIARVKQALAA